MIQINLVCVGNLKDQEYADMCNEYKKRISRFANISVIELKEKNNLDNINLIIESESQDIMNHIDCSKSVLLDVKGKQITSEELAEFISNWTNTNSSITFVIGGSYGTSDKLKESITSKISMSKMTFPHRLARVMLLEQIYRAFTINNNISYHK